MNIKQARRNLKRMEKQWWVLWFSPKFQRTVGFIEGHESLVSKGENNG